MESMISLDKVLPIIKNNTKDGEKYLRVQNGVANKFRECTKILYDFMKTESDHKNNGLPELITDGFDEEQIWQQLEIENESELLQFTTEISRVLAGKNDKLILPVSVTKPEEKNDGVDSDDEVIDEYVKNVENEMVDAKVSDSDDEIDLNIDMDANLRAEKKVDYRKLYKKPSIVDDKFFKLQQLDEYLTNEERKESRIDDNNSDDYSDKESVDLFEGHSEEQGENDTEDARMLKYADFFDDPENDFQRQVDEQTSHEKRVQFNLVNDSDENDYDGNDGNNDDKTGEQDDSPAVRSTLEFRKDRLQSRIEQFENEAVSKKPWQLTGEVRALDRPKNSLLEEFVEFDITSRPAPVITEQTTLRLEDVIKQRIKDNAWDDPVKKFKPVETPLEYKKKLVMDQEKSKKSLTQIYEDAFMKQKDALNLDNQEREEEEPQAHREIREAMHSLFRKLDALSNFHFTPKPAQPELKIISNVPAINMEEVAPVAATDATLLAPEEVEIKPRGDVIGKSERTETDMKRARRKKKVQQRENQKVKDKKEKTVSENFKTKTKKQVKSFHDTMVKKLTKDRNISAIGEASTKVPKTSTAFFTQLQDEVTSHIKSRTNQINKKKNKSVHSAVKLKL